ncbi:taste receptor type 2 member 4-like [Pelodytes ibericus]
MYFQAVFFLFVFSFIEIAVGIFLNAFIILMNFVWWLKCRSVQSIDLILVSIGLARLLLLITFVTDYFTLLFNGWLLESKYFWQIFSIAIMFVSFCSLWTDTLLCVFYCVKITNYSHRFFLYLKLNISRLVPRLLLASVTISFFSSLPCAWIVYETASNSTNISSALYDPQINMEVDFLNIPIIYVLGSSVPLFIFCTAISLLMGSLLSHTSRMKSMNAGSRNPRLDALTSAVRNMLSFMLFHLIYVGSMNLVNEILEVIKHLKINKAPGPDGYTNLEIKEDGILPYDVLQGRSAGNCTKRLIVLIGYSGAKKTLELALSLDAEKAFDSVNCGFMIQTLDRMVFARSIKSAIMTLYSGPMAKTVGPWWCSPCPAVKFES